jgi:hypothetical protein
MFDLSEKTLTFDNKPLNIVKWQVWFATPFGLIETLDQAIARCRENDMEPNAIVSPVPVAIDEAGRYEIIMRG